MDIDALSTRYDAGKASVDAGGLTVTPLNASWYRSIWGDDLFFLPSQPMVPPQRIASANPDGTLTLAYPWPGAAAVEEAYEIRYVGITERSTAQSRKVLEQLGDVKAWYDIIVEDDAARLALESASNPLPAGYRVLVRLDGVIWMKKTSAFGDWIGPVEFKGDTGNKGWSPAFGVVSDGERRVLQLTAWVGGEGAAPAGVGRYVGVAGLVDDIAQAIDVRGEGFLWGGAYNAASAYEKGSVTRQNGSSFIAAQAVPPGEAPSGAYPPVDTPYWAVLAAKGQDGEIDGVTPFWQSRILNDVDAAAARTGLELVKQTSETDDTTGRLLAVGAFGVGKTASLVTPDLNSVRPSGRYYCNSPTNGPGGNGWLDVFDLDADHAYHEFTNLSGVVFSRIRSGDVWSIWQPRTEMYLHVREEQAQNVAGGAAAAGGNDRVLNAVKFNNIPGASVASNRITLPEGVYKVEVKSPAYAVDAFKVALLEYPSLAILLEGINAFSWSTTPSAVTFGEVTGILTVPSGGKTFFVRLYAAVGKGVNGLGVQVNRSGLVEVYTDVMIKRIR